MTIINSVIKGKQPVIDTLNVTPTTSAQQITAPSGTDGYSPVNVSAVTAAIDANIVAGNIKKDVQILGVTGSYEGTAPTGTKYITANGVYNVTNFESADVQVPTTAPDFYIDKTLSSAGDLSLSTNLPNFSHVKTIGNYALYYGFAYLRATGTLDLGNVEGIDQYGLNNAFRNSTITSVVADKLVYINYAGLANAFSSCSSISGQIVFTNLQYLNDYSMQYTFSSCSGLTSASFPKLVSLSGMRCMEYCFTGCSSLAHIYFGGLKSNSFSTTNAFSGLVSGITGCTIHFPSNLDPQSGSTTISSLAGYPNFGGTNTILSFDLPATA